uniref:tetratricopeptide repeat-containing sensor histidine kinase n=2 Tax=Roseivirga sp. TaxID=1964215 RepID=UPI004048793D
MRSCNFLSLLIFHSWLGLIVLLTPSSLHAFFPQNQPKIKELQEEADRIGKNNLDSVLLLLKMADDLAPKKDTQKIQAENSWIKAKTYYGLRDYSESKKFGELAIRMANSAKHYQVLADAHNLLGILIKREGRVDSAIDEYRLSLKYKELLSDSLGIAKTLQNIGLAYRELELHDSALVYYQKSIDIKSGLNDTISLAKTISNLGTYYGDVGQYQTALTKFQEAIKIYSKGNYQEDLARNYINVGISYRRLGYYQLALKFYLKGLDVYRSLGLKLEEGKSYYNIGALYSGMSNIPEALNYYSESWRIYESMDNDLDKADLFLGLGEVHLKDNNPDEALKFFKMSEDIYVKRGKPSDLALVQHGYGRAYALLEQYPKAKAYYQETILKQKELSGTNELGNVYNSLAVTNYRAKEYNEALSNYRKGLEIAQELKLPALIRGSLLGLSEVYEALGNSKRAYQYRLQYETVKDSLDNIEKSRQIAELREVYESEKKDEQITQLELENEVVNAKSEANAALADKQRSEKLIFVITALALFVLAITLYFYFRQRLALTKLKVREEKEGHIKAVNELMVQQQTKTLEAMVEGQEKERKRIAKELHDHFGSLMAAVKVNLTAVAENNFITIENSDQMKNLSVLVDKACEDIRSLSHSMNIGISENFGLLPALKDLAYSISQSERIQVQFHASNFHQELDLATEVTAYRLVQELVSNALKHAKASKITIQLTCLDNILNLIVEDNGVGFDADHLMENSLGIGLKSIQGRIADMQGDFQVDSRIGKGTTVIIDLPVTSELALEMS